MVKTKQTEPWRFGSAFKFKPNSAHFCYKRHTHIHAWGPQTEWMNHKTRPHKFWTDFQLQLMVVSNKNYNSTLALASCFTWKQWKLMLLLQRTLGEVTQCNHYLSLFLSSFSNLWKKPFLRLNSTVKIKKMQYTAMALKLQFLMLSSSYEKVGQNEL